MSASGQSTVGWESRLRSETERVRKQEAQRFRETMDAMYQSFAEQLKIDVERSQNEISNVMVESLRQRVRLKESLQIALSAAVLVVLIGGAVWIGAGVFQAMTSESIKALTEQRQLLKAEVARLESRKEELSGWDIRIHKNDSSMYWIDIPAEMNPQARVFQNDKRPTLVWERK